MAEVTSISMSRNEKAVWDILARVPDPEIPAVSVVDLGIVREVRLDGGALEVVITPTYSGCPATDVIARDVAAALHKNGYPDARVTTALSPAWTTDWITDAGREKLRAFGIAPPPRMERRIKSLLGEDPAVQCPRCGSADTRKVSNFGSTPCKAHFTCNACLEPFDYFKCL